MAKAKDRYYVVRDKKDDLKPVALIKATNTSQASRHHHTKNFITEFADQETFALAIESGVKRETASPQADVEDETAEA